MQGMARPHGLVIAGLVGASAVTGVASADDTQANPPNASREGVLVGAGFDVGGAARGVLAQLDGRLGWMVTPRLGVFGAAVVGSGVGWEMSRYHVEGAGLRAWLSDTWFIGGRIGWAHTAARDEDEREDRTRRASGLGYLVEAGAEGVVVGPRAAGVGIDVHLGVLRTGEFRGVFLGVGASYY